MVPVGGIGGAVGMCLSVRGSVERESGFGRSSAPVYCPSGLHSGRQPLAVGTPWPRRVSPGSPPQLEG